MASAQASDDMVNSLKELPEALQALLSGKKKGERLALTNLLRDDTGKSLTISNLKEL
jgi:hypothetical protein